jgi:predicted Zn-dependent protease with MMP-like domain
MASPIHLARQRFEQLVAKAMSGLPEEFLDRLDNVVVLVEQEPPDDMPDTLGLYEGVPMIERGTNDLLLPDQITLFQGPIERICQSEAEIEEEIRLTVLHEVGHFFGLDEDQLEQY